MRCDEARSLLGAHGDGELDQARSAAVADHLEACGDCRALANDERRLIASLKSASYEPAPPDLAARVSARLALEELDASTTSNVVPTHRPSRPAMFLRRAAAVILACALSAATSWYLTKASFEHAYLTHDVLAAHVRSLLPESAVQVASSDRHSVKPWFAGRIDFAPDVKDLASEGFALVGGRLDYLGERRVAVLVYKRREHVINVFSWPAETGVVSGTTLPEPRELVLRGYNGLRWSSGGMEHWAVSDLNAAELAQLVKLLS